MNSKTILEYIRTILIAMFVTFLLVILFLFAVKHQVLTAHIRAIKIEQAGKIDFKLVDSEISKNKMLELKNPDDFGINLQLGTLYEMKKDFKNSEIEYKKAIAKASYGEYRPSYELALLYVTTNRLEEAQAVMDNIEEHPDPKLIKYKSDIFNKLGDKYYNKSDYDDASDMYQKSLFYANILKLKSIKAIKGSLASSYVYLAEQKVSELQVDDAIDYLQRARAIFDAPIIKYKLALLLVKDNPKSASMYFDQVFKEAPEIINYDVYVGFLNQMSKESENSGNFAQADLYQYKIKRLQEYSSINIISVDDLNLDLADGGISLNKWHTRYNIDFACQFSNMSVHDIDSLFLQVDFKTKDKILYVYRQQIFDKNSVLKARTVGPPIYISTSISRTNEYQMPKDLVAQIYVSKSNSSFKILLKEIPIKEKSPKLQFRLFGRKFVLPF